MRHPDIPRYITIALDIAYRIKNDDLKEGNKIKGRSMLASEYNVSPETIRRSISLLKDMDVVEVIEKSGIKIKSKVNAEKFIQTTEIKSDLSTIQKVFYELLDERKALDDQIHLHLQEIVDYSTKFKEIDHITNYQQEIPPTSHLINKTIKEIMFWHYTQATIIGVKRSGVFYISPGPHFQFQVNDQLIFVCLSENYSKTIEFINTPL